LTKTRGNILASYVAKPESDIAVSSDNKSQLVSQKYIKRKIQDSLPITFRETPPIASTVNRKRVAKSKENNHVIGHTFLLVPGNYDAVEHQLPNEKDVKVASTWAFNNRPLREALHLEPDLQDMKEIVLGAVSSPMQRILES